MCEAGQAACGIGEREGERGGRHLFWRLCFRLLPGQVLWLRDRNGRGKTSLLRLMAGLEDEDRNSNTFLLAPAACA
jgi:ABC-type transport system involved in cytochrome c biogenesis ATPase subunit